MGSCSFCPTGRHDSLTFHWRNNSGAGQTQHLTTWRLLHGGLPRSTSPWRRHPICRVSIPRVPPNYVNYCSTFRNKGAVRRDTPSPTARTNSGTPREKQWVAVRNTLTPITQQTNFIITDFSLYFFNTTINLAQFKKALQTTITITTQFASRKAK